MRPQPPLLVLGVLLLALGFAIFGWLVLRQPDSQERVQLPSRAAEPVDIATGVVEGSRVWPIIAGLSIAAGGTCVGIGLNRWRSQPRT